MLNSVKILLDLIIINLVRARVSPYFSVGRQMKIKFQTKLKFIEYKWKSYLSNKMTAKGRSSFCP